MHLLAEGTPISLLMDLFDPTGPHSEDLLAHEHLAHEHLAHKH